MSVPGLEHYDAQYLGPSAARLFSYREQFLYAVRSNPQSVLLVGKGDGVVVDLLRQARISITTLDIEPGLRPDVVGSVIALPACDEAFDVSVCCQVLEH